MFSEIKTKPKPGHLQRICNKNSIRKFKSHTTLHHNGTYLYLRGNWFITKNFISNQIINHAIGQKKSFRYLRLKNFTFQALLLGKLLEDRSHQNKGEMGGSGSRERWRKSSGKCWGKARIRPWHQVWAWPVQMWVGLRFHKTIKPMKQLSHLQQENT